MFFYLLSYIMNMQKWYKEFDFFLENLEHIYVHADFNPMKKFLKNPQKSYKQKQVWRTWVKVEKVNISSRFFK